MSIAFYQKRRTGFSVIAELRLVIHPFQDNLFLCAMDRSRWRKQLRDDGWPW